LLQHALLLEQALLDLLDAELEIVALREEVLNLYFQLAHLHYG
jgi:hypothetical protein